MSTTSRSAAWTASLAGAALCLTVITMTVFHAWSAGLFTGLILLPYFLAFAGLGALFVFRASGRSHRALAATTALLALLTFASYVPALAFGRSGCMSGMILLVGIPFSLGFPLVFAVCWFLYGLKRNA